MTEMHHADAALDICVVILRQMREAADHLMRMSMQRERIVHPQ